MNSWQRRAHKTSRQDAKHHFDLFFTRQPTMTVVERKFRTGLHCIHTSNCLTRRVRTRASRTTIVLHQFLPSQRSCRACMFV